jgi:uncharacterized protein (DUF433 family)
MIHWYFRAAADLTPSSGVARSTNLQYILMTHANFVPICKEDKGRRMTHARIEINPDIMFGKPVIKGTRITVEHILRKLAGGMPVEEILKDHPVLTADDIYAAIGFAADYLAHEDIVFASEQ